MKNKIVCLFALVLLLPLYAYDETSCKSSWGKIIERHDSLEEYESIVNICGGELRGKLQKLISSNRRVGYTSARKFLFSDLDNVDGVVCSVYISSCIATSSIPNHQIMNTEHLWPQSRGASGIAKSDMHHLRPANSQVNSRRGNHPFCEVENVQWSEMGSRYGERADGTRCFEPRDIVKGDVARSMLYFSVRYGKAIDEIEESDFRLWHLEDLPTEQELARNNSIDQFQGNRNPFIDIPELAELITNY
jgi:deoxyribonuclease I